MRGKTIARLIEAPYRWRDWATQPDGLTGPDLLAFLTDEQTTLPTDTHGPGLFAYLRNLRGDNANRERRDVIATVFQGLANRMESGYLLRDVINLIDGIHFDSSEEIHMLGWLYETLLREMRDVAGDSGEFYTPRPVVQFMVNVTDPQLGETVLDPACGTGGFLVETYRYMEKQADTVKKRKRLQEHSIYAGEAKSLPFLLAQMNLLLHGLDAPRIDSWQLVARPPGRDRRKPSGSTSSSQIRPLAEKRKPASSTISPKTGAQRKPRCCSCNSSCVDSSAPVSGRAGVVVPNGTLFGDGVSARIKADLLERFNLHTVVRLPEGVFAPYTRHSDQPDFLRHQQDRPRPSGTTSSLDPRDARNTPRPRP